MTRAPAGWGINGALEDAPGLRAAGASDVIRGASICYWLGSLNYVPSIEDIRARFDVSRATAYRYRCFALNEGSGRIYTKRPAPTDRPKRTTA